jgi:hypothetical protein
MSANEGRDSIEQAVANLQREVLAMRQILTLLLAHHAMHFRHIVHCPQHDK